MKSITLTLKSGGGVEYAENSYSVSGENEATTVEFLFPEAYRGYIKCVTPSRGATQGEETLLPSTGDRYVYRIPQAYLKSGYLALNVSAFQRNDRLEKVKVARWLPYLIKVA